MIPPVGTAGGNLVRRATLRGGGTFHVGESPVQAKAADSAEAAAPASLVGLLSLQEMEIGGQERRTANHNQALLAKLSGLQRLVLSGAAGAGALDELAALADSTIETADPGLCAISTAVLQRVKIELAKRGR